MDFTREGLQADFLWLGEGPTRQPARRGRSFAGVYSFFPVRGPKPGATVLATFSDPRAAAAGKQPPYFVEQFYGSGRVFYMGSGEMWRLRRVDPAYFEQFYTKLIRHVSQGRLLRGSSRGVLLVGQDRYLLGNTVEVRAQLTNARLAAAGRPVRRAGSDSAQRRACRTVHAGRRPVAAGQLRRPVPPCCKRAIIAWNCPCRKAPTSGSPAASRSRCPNWSGKTRSATTPC